MSITSAVKSPRGAAAAARAPFLGGALGFLWRARTWRLAGFASSIKLFSRSNFPGSTTVRVKVLVGPAKPLGGRT